MTKAADAGQLGAEDEKLETSTDDDSKTAKDRLAQPERTTASDSVEMKPMSKQQIINTVALYSAYMAFGFSLTLWGPALVDMANLMDTDIKTIVFIFTAQSAGAILGSFIVAFLTGRINNNFLLIPCVSVVVACLIISPWLPNVIWLIVIMCVSGVFGTSIHTIVQVYSMALWRQNKRKSSLMQGVFGVFSIAATLAPFIIEPFLSKSGTTTDILNQTIINYSIADNTTVVHSDTTLPSEQPPTETKVQYGFLTIACICSIAIFICVFAFCSEGMTIRILKGQEQEEEKTRRTKHTMLFRIAFILISSAMFALYISIEVTLGNMLATFVTIGLKWEKYKGSLMTSIYWGTFGVSRLCAIVIVRFVSPVRMLTAQILTIVVSLVILAAAADVHEAVGWVFFAVIGVAEGPFFGAGLILVGSVMKMDGAFSATLTIANSVAIMSASAIVGFLFETYGHMTMMYYLLATSVLLLVVFAVVQLVSSRAHRETAKKSREAEMEGLNADEQPGTS